MKKDIILKYDEDIAIETGALVGKRYVFWLSLIAILVAISGAIFEFVCYKNGFSEVIYSKYTLKILYVSLAIALVWLILFPIWLPGTYAETTVFVIKKGVFYRIRNKKDNFFDREKYLENSKFLDEVILNLPNKNENVKIEEFSEYKVLKKGKKSTTVQVKKKNSYKKIKIYNIYENYEKIG